MLRLVRRFLRTASTLLNQAFRVCWLIPLHVDDDERIVRAIYSPFHLNKKKTRLTATAYDPYPGTDEISVMRLDYIGTCACKREARKIENPQKKKTYYGFAVLNVGTVRQANMSLTDSRHNFCGHADILFMMDVLKNRQAKEPLSAADGKRLKDLQDHLLASSRYVPDPKPNHWRWTGAPLDPP